MGIKVLAKEKLWFLEIINKYKWNHFLKGILHFFILFFGNRLILSLPQS